MTYLIFLLLQFWSGLFYFARTFKRKIFAVDHGPWLIIKSTDLLTRTQSVIFTYDLFIRTLKVFKLFCYFVVTMNCKFLNAKYKNDWTHCSTCHSVSKLSSLFFYTLPSYSSKVDFSQDSSSSTTITKQNGKYQKI